MKLPGRQVGMQVRPRGLPPLALARRHHDLNARRVFEGVRFHADALLVFPWQIAEVVVFAGKQLAPTCSCRRRLARE